MESGTLGSLTDVDGSYAVLGRVLHPQLLSFCGDHMMQKYSRFRLNAKEMLVDDMCPDNLQKLGAVIQKRFLSVRDKISTIAVAYLIRARAVRSDQYLALLMGMCQVFESALSSDL